jgi:large subunit ribosomal protein L10
MSTREERTEAIGVLEREFTQARGIYLTDINRINVEQMTALRNSFRKKGVKYIVVKNTLARIACEKSGKKELAPYLKGAVGVALASAESMAPAKIIKDFQKDHKELLEVKVAHVDGSVFGGSDVVKLADIPPREVLLAQLLGLLQAPMANLAGSLNGVMVKFAGTLEGLKNKKQSEEVQ